MNSFSKIVIIINIYFNEPVGITKFWHLSQPGNGFVIEDHLVEWLFQLTVYTSLNIVQIKKYCIRKYKTLLRSYLVGLEEFDFASIYPRSRLARP